MLHGMDEYLTANEVADLLRLSIHTLSAWRTRANADGPPWIKMGDSIRYSRSDLEAWLEARRHTADGQA